MKYTSRNLITEVQYNFSSAIGGARAFIVTVQVLWQQFTSREIYSSYY